MTTRRTIAVFGAALLLAPGSARAESLEESCRFAEALGDRLRMPDLGLDYLEALKAPAGQEAPRDQAILSLLDMQVRQDPSQGEAALKRGEKLAASALAGMAPAPQGTKRPPPSLQDFRTALAWFRIAQAASKGADAGARLRKLHEQTRQAYRVLVGTDIEDANLKLDLMIEYQMTDGATVLAMRAAQGLGKTEKLEALAHGVESFGEVRYAYDNPEQPDEVGFPNAYRGLAQCQRGIAEEAADPAERKKAMDEARKLLNAILNNPINPNVARPYQDEARHTAAKDLIDIAFAPGGNLAEAAKAVADFRKKAAGRGVLMDRARLLGARVDMENARAAKGPPAETLKARAIQAAREVKEGGGAAAPEAEALLAEWEGATASSRRNWKSEADKAFEAKGTDEAARKYRAVLRTARGNSKLLSQAWAGVGACFQAQQRLLEASLAFERAARIHPSGPQAGSFAAQAVGCLQKGSEALPPEAMAAPRKEALLLLTGFPDHKAAPSAAYFLARILINEKDYRGAEGYLSGLKPDYDNYAEALFFLGSCRVSLLRELERRGEPAGAALQAAEAALSAFLERAKGKPDLVPLIPRVASQRIEINLQADPAKALRLIAEYPQAHPQAKDPIAELPRQAAIAHAAQGEWDAAAKRWEEAAQAAGERKPWPLMGAARALQRLCEARQGEAGAASLAQTLRNQLFKLQPFKFSEAAKRFQENLEQKPPRWADAIAAGEQIQENILEDRETLELYLKDPKAAGWLAWFREKLPDCYLETQAWAKAAELLAKRQEDEIIRRRLKPEPGKMPPPLPGDLQGLWRKTALACTRTAEQMPAGEPRKAMAERAADSWVGLLLDSIGVQDADYWTLLLDAVKAEVMAGRYAAAKDRVRGTWLTYPELGGQKDRFVETVRSLQQVEPGFDPQAKALLEELTGEAGSP